MQKKIILRNEKTGEYFTNNYREWWSKDIRESFKYSMDENIDGIINLLIEEDYNNALQGIEYIEIVTFYC